MIKLNLKRQDFKKILTGAGIASAGAILTYVSQFVSQAELKLVLFGVTLDLTPVIVAGWSIFANTARKSWNNRKK